LENTTPILCLNNIRASRAATRVLSGFNLSLQPQEIVWVLGPNGVGKTTLLRVAAGLLMPESGKVLWNGKSLNAARNEREFSVHYIGHNNGIKLSLSVEENLYLAQATLGIKNTCTVAQALLEVGLTHKHNVVCRELSAGQQRRVALARLFFLPAKVWILDEPFTAMDEQGLQLLASLFMYQLNSGGSILASTHRLFAEKDIFTSHAQRFITLQQSVPYQ